MTLTRRRFLTISAALAIASPAHAASLYHAQGQALGARVTILLAHPNAKNVAARAFAEIDRLEQIFSLYRVNSALMRLNTDGRLDAPPFEMLECLSLCDQMHAATAGLFDPTIQPLWASYAAHFAAGHAPDAAAIDTALTAVGWRKVQFDEGAVRLRRGMSLTLNGIAQGYIADRVTTMLKNEGLTNILVDTGEFRALGGHPNGTAWPVRLVTGASVPLRDMALASSAPRGTSFDQAGQVGHILDPRNGRPAEPRWQLVSVTSPSAAMADALSTAFCLMRREDIKRALAKTPNAQLAELKIQA